MPFGGVSVICACPSVHPRPPACVCCLLLRHLTADAAADCAVVGDMHQMPPVQRAPLYDPNQPASRPDAIAGHLLFKAVHAVVTLRKSYRQQMDPEYAAALRRMRMSTLTQADLDLINACVLAPGDTPPPLPESAGRRHIVCFTNAERYAVNRRLEQALCDSLVGDAARHSEPPHPEHGRAFIAVDARIRRTNTARAPVSDTVETLLRNGVKGDRCLGDRPPTLFLAPGSPLTLTDNT